MSGPRGIHLSGTQVIASVLATLTGAVAASYLGVGGTLVGAAVGSLASTMGTEIYKHYLLRSKEGLRSAGQVLHQSGARTRTGNTMGHTAAGASRAGRHAGSGSQASQQETTQDLATQDLADRETADRETAVWDRRQYGTPRDPQETQTIPGVPAQWNGTGHSGGTSSGGSGPDDTASQHAHGNLAGEGPAGDQTARGSLWGAVTSFFGGLTRRQWLTYGGTAAGFFLVVVAGITVFELVSGKQLGHVVYGGHSSPQQTTHPASTPSATPSATPSGSTSATPTSSSASTSGTPTPGSSGTASSPSTVPSPTPSTGSSGAARSVTTVTPTP